MAVAIETMTGLAKGPDVALKAMPTEPASMVRDVLRKNISNIRDSLDPESVLDVFEENNTFGNATLSIVRDLRELQSTSETNRQIRELFAKRPQLYIELKKALHKTGQCRLLKYLEESQNEVHEQHIGEREGCECELCSQAFAQCGGCFQFVTIILIGSEAPKQSGSDVGVSFGMCIVSLLCLIACIAALVYSFYRHRRLKLEEENEETQTRTVYQYSEYETEDEYVSRISSTSTIVDLNLGDDAF